MYCSGFGIVRRKLRVYNGDTVQALGRFYRRFPVLHIFLLLAVLPPAGIFGQPENAEDGGLVVISSLSGSESETAETLARNITDTLELSLRLAAGARVERADFLSPHESLDQARLYYDQVSAGRAVFGTVEPHPEGGYTVRAGLWRSDRGAEAREQEYRVRSVLEIFDVADRIALDLASQIAGRELSFGRVVIENSRDLPEYSIYVDGILAARNVRELRVLSGEREIVIARPGAVSDEVVTRRKVRVPADGSVRVTLEPTETGEAAQPAQGDDSREAAETPEQAIDGGARSGLFQVSFNPMGFLQFGPIFEASLRAWGETYLGASIRLSGLGLAYHLVNMDFEESYSVSLLSFGPALNSTSLFEYSDTPHRFYFSTYLGADFGGGSGSDGVGDWEDEWFSVIPAIGGGHRWRTGRGFFVNLGLMAGAVIGVTYHWYYTAEPDLLYDQGDTWSFPFFMLEISLGRESR